MFNNQRYITKGVQNMLEPALQNALWYMVETMQVEEKDYLQVFTLYPAGSVQVVEHSQEQPSYSLISYLPDFTPVTTEVYVIDDKTHSTMLLAEEY